MDRRLISVASSFALRFGAPARFAASAPGRVNLIGEHTDYNDGFVLPLAIERRVVIVAAPARGGVSRLYAADLDEEVEVDLERPLVPRPDGSWANHLLGVAHGLAAHDLTVPNLDLLLTSDVPIGAGLGSGAAVEVAAATLFEHVAGATLDPVRKADLCRRAEHRFVGTRCGIMDMLAAVLAVPGHALLIDCRTNAAEPIRMPPAERAALLVVQTGVRRRLAEGAYGARRAACERAAAQLGVASLRDATPEAVASSSLGAPERQRASHVVAENARTIRAAGHLRDGDLDAFGRAMLDSHDSLRDLYEVSCPELEIVADAARRRVGAGVFGARMTGAGFGGCAIALCEPSSRDAVIASVQEAFAAEFGRTPEIFETGAGDPARVHQL